MWSGPDHESYICLTAHWLDENWNYRHALLDIYLCSDRHTGENLRDWIIQILKDNDISVRFFPLFSFSVFCDFSDFPSSFLQRLDVSAVTHDHSGDITKAIRLGGLHSFLCICHEFDLSVQKGVACPLFAKTFEQAAHINSLLRNCRNLYRRLRSEQVNFVLIIVSPRSLRSYSFVDSRWSSGNMTVFQ
jgi:hypothetical protein